MLAADAIVSFQDWLEQRKGDEMNNENNFLSAISNETGISVETLMYEKAKFVMTRKGSFLDRHSALIDFSKKMIGASKTAELMSKNLGIDYEKASTDLMMPRLDHGLANNIILGRTVDMDIFL